jgi:DNA-directed RNA polymerase specialized sigma24 family protein
MLTPHSYVSEKGVRILVSETETRSTEAIEAIYISLSGALRAIAVRRHGVPPADAECIVQDVFVSFLLNESRIRKETAWLVAAVCDASRWYWRKRFGCAEVALERESRLSRRNLIDRRITARQIVRQVSARSAETIYRHYWLGATAREMAAESATTVRYVEKLIHQSLFDARNAYQRFVRVETPRVDTFSRSASAAIRSTGAPER